jgi:hypothetical protein
LLTSRFRAHHPLKACEYCFVEDVRDHGWAYWHPQVQVTPRVWSPRSVPLGHTVARPSRIGRFSLVRMGRRGAEGHRRDRRSCGRPGAFVRAPA